MSVNKVMLLGHLGQDPDVRYNPSGTPVCNFSLATNEYWVDKEDQKQKRTEWHRIVVWGKMGENCGRYLAKGRQVFVEGRLETRSWEDKEGQKRYTTEIVARNVQFISGGEAMAERPQNHQQEKPSPVEKNGLDEKAPSNTKPYTAHTDTNFTADDIPF